MIVLFFFCFFVRCENLLKKQCYERVAAVIRNLTG